MAYNFTQRITKGKYEVQVDPVALYGWFEHETLGDESGGGLWFCSDAGKLILTDYDGVYELPKDVAGALRELGHIVDAETFN